VIREGRDATGIGGADLAGKLPVLSRLENVCELGGVLIAVSRLDSGGLKLETGVEKSRARLATSSEFQQKNR
jgi:hypothetical protein